jgi:ribosomal RNA-processing protein 12
MGKGRVRAKGAKGKRWRKGQSGLSNPSEVLHRQAARGKFGDHLSRDKRASAPLTAEALARLHSTQEQLDRDGDVDLETSSSAGTTSAASSSALTLIETSHPVFGTVRKLWNSPTESHRVICAVLAAVSDVVRSQDGRNTETEYYGALMSVLESCDDEKSVAAICYLLCLLMPSLPSEVLQVKYSTSCKILTKQLTRHETSSSTALLKSLVRALGLLLEAQPPSVWSDSHCQKVFQNILNFTVHPKPKLRKAAQAAVVAMLREGSASGEPHTAAPPTARHCRHVIDRGGETATLHVLGMLRECLDNFPTLHVKSLCEAVLKTMTLASTMVRTTCLRTLHGALTSQAGPQGLTSSLTARIISALYDHQPGLEDWQLLQAWLTVMMAAHTRLARLDQELCLAHLVKFFSTAVSCLVSHSSTVTDTTAAALQNLLTAVVGPHVASLDSCSKSQLQQIGDMYTAVVKGLEFKYRSSWRQVLKTLAVFHRVAGDKCHSVMAQQLPALVSLHSLPDFSLSGQLEEALGTAIAAMGPEVVLTYVPLDLDSGGDVYPPEFPTSWLLPVLRDHISHSRLAFFRDHLLPIATTLRNTGERYQVEGKKMAAKLYTTLYHQVWFLLPGFCRGPQDVPDSFPGLARILGTALTAQPQLRITIATSLRQLVESCRGKEEEVGVVARFSKNYLPILFNLYTSEEEEEEEEGVRQAVLQCVEAYISITDPSLVTTLSSSALTNLSLPNLTPGKKYRLLDLVAVMATALPLSPLQDLLDSVSPLLDSVDARVQKKCYRVLERVLTSERQPQKTFVRENLLQLMSLLCGSLSTSSPASKKPRLRCLLCLVDHIGHDSHHFLNKLTPEVILCTKETNEKCRAMAFQLLVRMGHAAQRCYGLSPEGT